MLIRKIIHLLFISTQVKSFSSVRKHNIMRDMSLQGIPFNDESSKYKSEVKMERTNHDPFTIKFYGSVTTESCMALSNTIETLNSKAKDMELKYDFRVPIKLHLQSLGGELMPAFYVCDLIKSIDTPVHIYIDGYVASAASLIAVCGDKRYMTKHSSILIHQLTSSTSGKFAEMRDGMSNLHLFMENLKDIYLENTKIEESKLECLFESDVWMSADKCLLLGLVDDII